MKVTLSARELHGAAIHAREKEQDFEKALKLLDEALLATDKNDSEELAGIAGSRQNIYQHLFDQTQNKSFLVVAKHSAMAAVEIAESTDMAEKALPYRDLGNVQLKLEEFGDAVENYNKSLSSDESPSLKRPGVHGEIQSQLGFAEYMSGDKETGLKNMNEAIEELEADTGANQYEHDVWLSGALMRKAKATGDKTVLEEARKIIESNSELVLRKQQLEKLTSELAS